MGMMDKLLDAMRLNPDEDFDDDDELDDEYDFYDDEEDDYDIPSGPSEREIRRQQAAEEKAAKRESKRREKEEAAAAREAERGERSSENRDMSRSSSRKAGDEYVYNRKAEKQAASRSSKITPISSRSSSSRSLGGSGMAVRIIKPTAVDDEVQIVDTLLEGRTVIINMEGFDLAIAQRIIDFTIGATYAMSGDLQRISNYIFLATPPGVDISGDISNIKEQYEDED